MAKVHLTMLQLLENDLKVAEATSTSTRMDPVIHVLRMVITYLEGLALIHVFVYRVL